MFCGRGLTLSEQRDQHHRAGSYGQYEHHSQEGTTIRIFALQFPRAILVTPQSLPVYFP